MDLRGLKYFEAVFEAGSISAAAKACFVSQPSISTALSQLEQTLDAPLFVRHARGVFPTAEAKKLYPLSKGLTGSAQAIVGMFRESPVSVPLRLGLMRSLGADRMTGILKDLSGRISNLELTLVDPEEPCDVRIIDSANLAHNEDFIPIWTDRYLLAIPRGYRLSLEDEVKLSDFEGLPFIHRNTCLALVKLKTILDHENINYQIRANIRTVEYAQSLVSAEVGAALLPDWEEIRARQDLVLRPIKDHAFSRTIGLAYKKHKKDHALVRSCVAVCQTITIDS